MVDQSPEATPAESGEGLLAGAVPDGMCKEEPLPQAAPSCPKPDDDDFRIHNCDQRSPVIHFAHPAIGPPLKLEQRGASHQGFDAGTSSVIWPVAAHMAKHLCDHPEMVRGRSVVELGAGIGILGAALAALGANPVVLTDSEQALPLLGRNKALLSERSVSVQVAELLWGEAAHHARVLALNDSTAFDIVVASDVVVRAFDTDKLWESCEALLPRDESRSATVMIGFEDRDDWETIGTFIGMAEAAGFVTSTCPLALEEEEEDDDWQMCMYTFRREGP